MNAEIVEDPFICKKNKNRVNLANTFTKSCGDLYEDRGNVDYFNAFYFNKLTFF